MSLPARGQVTFGRIQPNPRTALNVRMNMIAVVALYASLATFPGGSTADLAASVFQATGRNIFLTQAYVQPIKKFDYETKTFDDLAFDLRMNAKLHEVSGPNLVFDDEILPPFRIPKLGVGKQASAPSWKSLTADDISAGNVSFQTTGSQRLDPASLANAPFSKHVTVNWLFEKYGVAVCASKLDEKTFISCVARSVGAAFVDAPAGYRLDLDPEQLRSRVLNLIAARPPADSSKPSEAELRVAENLQLLAAIFRDADATAISAAFKEPGASSEFVASASSRLGNDLVEALGSAGQARLVNRNWVSIKTPGGVAYMSPRMGFTVTLSANFTARISIDAV